MLNWNSTAVLTSRIDPDVRITFRKFTQRRKAALELALAEYRELVRDKMLDYAENCVIDFGLRDNDGNLVLNDEGKPEHSGDSDAVRAQKITRQTAFNGWLQGQVEQHLKPATLRTYIVSVEGLIVDGKPINDADGLLDGPEEIAEEAYQFIMVNGGLQESERKNLPSPITSPAAEDGQMSPATAAAA